MSILRLPRTYGNLKRLQEIAVVLVRHGFGHLLGRLRLAEIIPGAARLRLAVEGEAPLSADTAAPERLARVLESLGPTFIKFGQLLASRPDLFPPAYLEAFSRLRDRVEPFDTDEAVRVIETGLNAGLDDVFGAFDRTATASGSIGQVHYATLRSGAPVVVKVKRPGTDRRVRDDLDLLIWFAGLAEKHLPEVAPFRPRELCEEFARSMRRELDFVSEASYTAKFARDFENEPGVRIPRVFWEHISRDVLVVERLEGLRLSSAEAAALPSAERMRLGELIGRAFMRQFFVTGLFHGDPHPGNLFLLPDGKLGLIDFGQAGHLSAEMRHQLVVGFTALAQGDFDAVADMYADMGGLSDTTDMSAFKVDLMSLVDRYYGVPVEKMDLGQIFEEIVTVTREHGMRLPRELVLLGKSLVMMVGVAQRLDPGFRIDLAAQPYVKHIFKEEFHPWKLLKGSAFSAYRLFIFLQRTPGDIRDLLQKARSGRIRVIFHHEALESLTQRMDQAFSRLSLALVIAAIIIGSALVLGSPSLGKLSLPILGETSLANFLGLFGFCTATLLGLWLIWRIFRSDRM
ncbi:MAG: AarF/ABC1/UbiB kinase family protein [Planctomycetota bacterium]